jgi:predicted dehydrogenase
MMDWQASDAVRAVLEKPILVIGLGSIGKRHVKNLFALGARNIILYDSDTSRALAVQDEIFDGIEGNVKTGVSVVTGLELACDLQPVAAIICTPTKKHLVNMMDAVTAGIEHLFIEKPICDYRAFETGSEPFGEWSTFVACNFRFTPGLQRVKQLIDEGAIGKVVSARAQFGQYLPDMRPNADHKKIYAANKSMGGGCLLDGIHEFDYLSWLLGPIAEAKAFTARLTDVTVDTEDVAEVILRFESGALGSVHEDYLSPIYRRDCVILGSEGYLIWHYRKEQEWIRLYHRDETKDIISEDFEHEDQDPNEMYLEQMQHFLRVCAGEERSQNTVADAYRLLETILNAK